MKGMRRIWLLPAVLIAVHLLFNIWMFVAVETSPDGEAVMGYGILATIVDFPSSLAANALDELVWKKEILWHSDDSAFRNFDRRFGFDRCNVGLFVVYVPVGTIQWGIVGFLLQLAWRKYKER